MADRYFIGSLKEGTCEKRVSPGSKLSFTGSTKFSSDFNNFLSNSENKDSLNQFLARQFIQLHAGKSQIIVVNFNETISSNDELLLSEEDISNCISEEADPRLIRHAISQANNGFQDITIRTLALMFSFLH